MAILTCEYKSKALIRGVKLHIILPDDGMTEDHKPPYKTLYFLPGYSATNTEIMTYLRFRMHSELKGIAVVFPDGENLFYQDIASQNTGYSTFVGKELVEVTRNLLPLSRKREDTYIGGISMGGYGAIYNGLRFRDTFSKIIAFSPAVDPYDLLVENPGPDFKESQFFNIFGTKETYLKSDSCLVHAYRTIPKEEQPALFMSCGTEDVVVYRTVEKLHRELCEENVAHLYREESGGHDFDFWERMMDPAFSFLADIPEKTKDRMLSR